MQPPSLPSSSPSLPMVPLLLLRKRPALATVSSALIALACAQARLSFLAPVIIDTRGTGELQGPSAGFNSMNANIMSHVSGGTIYNTQYPADFSQQSSAGTADVGEQRMGRPLLALTVALALQIIHMVTATLQSDPSTCFLLEGYSQGAAATVNALSNLKGAAFDAVKGVFLIGNPLRKPGLACNVDSQGGTSTSGRRGVESLSSSSGIPDDWVNKTRDVCAQGDGVCDSSIPGVITNPHLSYPYDTKVQDMGAKFGIDAVSNGTSQQHSSDGGNDNGKPSGTQPGPNVLSGGDPQPYSYGSGTNGQPMGTGFGSRFPSGGDPQPYSYGSGTNGQPMGTGFGSRFPSGGSPWRFPFGSGAHGQPMGTGFGSRFLQRRHPRHLSQGADATV